MPYTVKAKIELNFSFGAKAPQNWELNPRPEGRGYSKKRRPTGASLQKNNCKLNLLSAFFLPDIQQAFILFIILCDRSFELEFLFITIPENHIHIFTAVFTVGREE